MTVDRLGIRLVLQVGPTVPTPAPYAVMEGLRSVEVRSSNGARDGFQIELAIGRDTPLDVGLIASGVLDPPNRVVITLYMGVQPEVLIDGIITHVQNTFSPDPGESRLNITGEDLSLMMDLEERNANFEGRSDSEIVKEILKPYAARYKLRAVVTPTAEVPPPSERIPSQQATDLNHLKYLAERNGFVFFLEPVTPGVSRAYFGPDAPSGLPQPAINLGFASHRSAAGPLQGSYDALGPATPRVTVTEPTTGVEIPVPLPALTAVPGTARPAPSLRNTIVRGTTGLSVPAAALHGVAAVAEGSDAVRLTGEIDGIRYGEVLRSRRLVGVRGMGLTWDGLYTVEDVTHRIGPESYRQHFTLKRGGFVSTTPGVRP